MHLVLTAKNQLFCLNSACIFLARSGAVFSAKSVWESNDENSLSRLEAVAVKAGLNLAK
jgi:hypothetical protein